MMGKLRVAGCSVVLSGICALVGCSDDNEIAREVGGDPDSSIESSGNESSGNESGGDVSAASARLVTLDSDAEFFSAWREALAGEYDRYGAGAQGVPEAGGNVDDSDAVSIEAPQEPAASAGETADESTTTSGDSGGDFTTTNVQEGGVDEADLVKNDGEFLYVLQPFGGCSNCVDTATETDDVAGDPSADSSEPAFEQPPGQQATLRILALQPEVPDTSVQAEVSVETQGFATGMFLYRQGDERSLLLSENNFGGYYDWNYSQGWSGGKSSILKMNVSDPQNVNTQRLAFDGNVISSRLIDDRLILATRFYPDIEGLNPYAYPTEEDWLAALETIDLSDALPQYTRISDGVSLPMVSPSDCFVAGDVEEGNSWPDIITLAVVDADDLSLQSSACYLGASETLYASTEAVFLATTRYRYDDYPDFFPATEEDDVFTDDVVPQAINDPRIDTDIHQFDLNGSQIQYAGSGRVSGHLGWNELQKPFRMSESNGDLRVVTMSDNQDGSVSPVNLTVLRADGTGLLETIGKLPNEQQPAFIGKPAEQLYASRFLGDRAYLVTFRSTDPLYVLDLANPTEPALAGELEVEGYSDYLHPIDENTLLGIGMDAVPTPAGSGFGDGRDGALVQGVKVSLYNVSDPASPTEVDTLLLGQRGSYSNALYDHRAISILPPGNGRTATRVAFGIDIAGLAQPARRPDPEDAFTYYDWRFSALHGIEVRTGADAGLTLTGTLVAASADDPDNFYYGYGSGSERAIMVGDSTYYVYGERVRAANWFDFDNPSPLR